MADEVATLYIPVLPDTTQLTAQLDQLAARIRATDGTGCTRRRQRRPQQ